MMDEEATAAAAAVASAEALDSGVTAATVTTSNLPSEEKIDIKSLPKPVSTTAGSKSTGNRQRQDKRY